MSTKGRTKFTVGGNHPLLPLLRDRLIQKGYALIPWTDKPDFVLFGVPTTFESFESSMDQLCSLAQVITQAELPVLLLSDGTECPSTPLKPRTGRFLLARTAEYLFTRETRTMVLRPFNVYGEDIRYGVIHTFIEHARRKEPLPVNGNAYQLRAFLHQDDFYEAFDKLLYKFIRGARGIYDVGSGLKHNISIKRLADSIWQLTWPHDMVTVQVDEHILYTGVDGGQQHKVASIQKLVNFINWKPKVSLRTGLWQLIEG